MFEPTQTGAIASAKGSASPKASILERPQDRTLAVRTGLRIGAQGGGCDFLGKCENNCYDRYKTMDNNWGIKPSDCPMFCQDLML